MAENISSSNLDELYGEDNKVELEEKPEKSAKTSSTPALKRKPESLKLLQANTWKKPKKEEEVAKTEEELKVEEAEKKEYILKIEDACSPDLLGNHEEIIKMRRELKLQSMTLSELKKTWSRIMNINGADHPRHYAWQLGIVLARKLENILEAYPTFSAPSFASRIETNPLIRQKFHMWALDKFPHTEIAPHMSLAATVFQEYNAAREFAKRKQQQTEAWGNKAVSQELQDKFADL
jgi:hypothetical protein